jgi:haloalkane dehalogenase
VRRRGLIGFGRSDKPAEPGDYSYQRHVDWMAEVIFGRLGLAGVTLVGQDWGGCQPRRQQGASSN